MSSQQLQGMAYPNTSAHYAGVSCPAPANGPAWYLLQCKPRQGFRAEEHLSRQGFHCYHPIIDIERIQQNRRVRSSESLFPGYLFIRLDNTTDNWRPIRSTRGVNRIVSFNGQPLPVDDALIEQIRTRSAAGVPLPSLQPGDPVRITTGPFAELEVIFQSFDGQERAIILLNLLQRPQQVKVPVGHLRRA